MQVTLDVSSNKITTNGSVMLLSLSLGSVIWPAETSRLLLSRAGSPNKT